MEKPPINYVLLAKQFAMWGFLVAGVVGSGIFFGQEWGVSPWILIPAFAVMFFVAFRADPLDSEFLTRSPRSDNSDWPWQG